MYGGEGINGKPSFEVPDRESRSRKHCRTSPLRPDAGFQPLTVVVGGGDLVDLGSLHSVSIEQRLWTVLCTVVNELHESVRVEEGGERSPESPSCESYVARREVRRTLTTPGR